MRSWRSFRGKLMAIDDGMVMALGPPPVDGIGSAGGFKVMIKDVGNRGLEALQGAADNLTRAANAKPGLTNVFSTYRVGQPQIYLDVDRTRAKAAGVPLSAVFDALQSYLGGAYANDFTFEGRNWQVTVQADAGSRDHAEAIGRLKVPQWRGKHGPVGVAADRETGDRAIRSQPVQALLCRRHQWQHAAGRDDGSRFGVDPATGGEGTGPSGVCRAKRRSCRCRKK